MSADHSDLARGLLASNIYMTLGTADEHGHPWVSPVWFAAPSPAELLWVSHPEALHSRNLAARPEIGIVIFDSTLPPYTGQGLYMEATATEVGEPELARAIDNLSTASVEGGGAAWSADDVRAPARLRLYAASVRRWWVLGEADERIEVKLT